MADDGRSREGDVPRTRLRDHDAGDLALTALTFAVTAAAAGLEIGRRAAARRRHSRGADGRSGSVRFPTSH